MASQPLQGKEIDRKPRRMFDLCSQGELLGHIDAGRAFVVSRRFMREVLKRLNK